MIKNVKHPQKRVVVLSYKATKKIFIYNTCAELAVANDKSKIGISLGALWNALSKNNGVYENNICKIYYRKIKQQNDTEWQ